MQTLESPLQRIDVEYEQPACSTRHAWARVPVEPGAAERVALKEKIARLLKEKNAVMVSHYYVHPDLQDLAEATGGLGVLGHESFQFKGLELVMHDARALP